MIPLEALYPDEAARFRVVRAFSTMKQTNDGKIVVDFLTHCAEYLDKINRASTPPQLQWNQGAAQFLEDLNTLVQDAEPLAQKIREAVEARLNTAPRSSFSNL